MRTRSSKQETKVKVHRVHVTTQKWIRLKSQSTLYFSVTLQTTFKLEKLYKIYIERTTNFILIQMQYQQHVIFHSWSFYHHGTVTCTWRKSNWNLYFTSSEEFVVFICNPKVLTTRSSEILVNSIRYKSLIKIQSNKHNAVRLEIHRLQVVASTFSSESAGHGWSYHYKGIEMPQLPLIDEAASSFTSTQTEAVQPEDSVLLVLLLLFKSLSLLIQRLRICFNFCVE